jgi:hypothetical protein
VEKRLDKGDRQPFAAAGQGIARDLLNFGAKENYILYTTPLLLGVLHYKDYWDV